MAHRSVCARNRGGGAIRRLDRHDCGNRPRDGSAGQLAGGNQLGFEFGCVGSMGAPGRTSGCLYFFEHGVHDCLCAHDLARSEIAIQNGIAGRLLPRPATLQAQLVSLAGQTNFFGRLEPDWQRRATIADVPRSLTLGFYCRVPRQ